jgi:integrase
MQSLVERMKMDLELQNYSPRTIKSYLWHIKNFERDISRPAKELTQEHLRRYLYHLKTEKHYGRSYLSQAFSALKYLYQHIFDMPMTLRELRGPKREKKLPVVLSKQEIRRLLESIENLKYQCIMMVGYSAGLRLNEVLHLKVSDIDSERMQIRVDQGKGKKDRYTLLSKTLVIKLREYYKIYRPYQWLFPSRTSDQPLGSSPIQKTFRIAKKKPAYSNLRLFIH